MARRDPTSDVELTFDPTDWDAFASLAHRMVDTMLEHARTLELRPTWQESPPEIRAKILDEPTPIDAIGEEAAFEEFVRNVLPYGNGNADPRFVGWVQGNGTPLGMMADMLASGMNPHMAGFNQNPVAVERAVVEWLRQLMGFPEGSSGLLLSGGSMANLTALVVARNAKAGFDVREQGLRASSEELTLYCTAETHNWAKKTVEVLGLGNGSLRRVATNPDYSMDLVELQAAVTNDRESGCRPIAVLATAGTVNTGASDDLDALADLCARENLWMHVDGAFGAVANISPKLKHLVKGIERADSVAFDLHKWMYLPFEIACVLVRDGSAHRAAFSQDASYIAPLERGVIAGGQPFAELGIELTRSFKALKAWMSLKAYGVPKFAALIEQNVGQAQYLADCVGREPLMQLMAPAPLNIVCFRFVGQGGSLEGLNALNKELLFRLQERGDAVPSSTVLDSVFCIRACFVNHRTRKEHIDSLVSSVLEIGNELMTGRSHEPEKYNPAP